MTLQIKLKRLLGMKLTYEETVTEAKEDLMRYINAYEYNPKLHKEKKKQ